MSIDSNHPAFSKEENSFNPSSHYDKELFSQEPADNINRSMTNFSLANSTTNNPNKKFNLDEHKYISVNSMNKDKLYWLETSSSKITLIKVIDQTFYEGHLQLKNITSQFIVFKFKNSKECYTIIPSMYFIKPFESIIINIKRFERLELSASINTKDTVQIIVAKADKEIEDVNEAKQFLRKEDIYSPEYQVFLIPIEFDNGNNMLTYRKVLEERKSTMNEYNKMLNINNVTSCNEVKKHINKVKKEIQEYESTIEELMSKLGDMNKNNIIKRPEVIFNLETYNSMKNERECKETIKGKIPLSMFIFLICVALFIGKIIYIIIH